MYQNSLTRFNTNAVLRHGIRQRMRVAMPLVDQELQETESDAGVNGIHFGDVLMSCCWGWMRHAKFGNESEHIKIIQRPRAEELSVSSGVRTSITLQASHAAETTAELFFSLVSMFGNLSLMGVWPWVMTLIVLSSAEVTVKGILVPRVPTQFLWFTHDWMGRSRWYDMHVAPVPEGIVFMMCSYALGFVVAFEHALSHDIEEICPFWKFWGVKLVETRGVRHVHAVDCHQQSLWAEFAGPLPVQLLPLLHRDASLVRDPLVEGVPVSPFLGQGDVGQQCTQGPALDTADGSQASPFGCHLLHHWYLAGQSHRAHRRTFCG